MNNRNYNIFFHTHTISGILISVLLYIIFFAGSFSFFRDEIANWERGETVSTENGIVLDYNKALKALDSTHALYGRDLTFTQNYHEQNVAVNLTASKDTLQNEKGKQKSFLYLNNTTFKEQDYSASYNLGEFLYRLHFLTQIPHPVGYYLSGFIALFFLFAIITGVLVHWKKIVSSFYVFRPKEKLKVWWTDAHTSLGILGLPFQFVYAVTGAFFMIKSLVIAPSVMLLYQSDQNQFYKELGYANTQFDFENRPLEKAYNLNNLVAKTKNKWVDFDITKVEIQNYGTINMHITIDGETKYDKQFTGAGKIIYKIATDEVIAVKNPYTQTTYVDQVKNILYRVHFGDYGGYGLKIISFALGITSCFVIISGVMIWLVARDKKNIPERKRRFNRAVVNWYLSICLSMYPVTAFTFIIVKIWYPLGQDKTYAVYFITWLLLTLYFVIRKNLNHTNSLSLLLGSILGILIPVTNGLITGNWFWITFQNNQFQLFFIDMFWTILSLLTFYASYNLKFRSAIEE